LLLVDVGWAVLRLDYSRDAASRQSAGLVRSQVVELRPWAQRIDAAV